MQIITEMDRVIGVCGEEVECDMGFGLVSLSGKSQ
jgi:hypothetical protein